MFTRCLTPLVPDELRKRRNNNARVSPCMALQEQALGTKAIEAGV